MTKTKKNKKNTKRRLLLLLFLLVLTVAMTIGSTVAWFTANRAVNVDSIDVKVNTVNGLQVSVDAVNWKAKVSRNDFTTGAASYYASNTNQFPKIMENVSTVGTIENGRMKMFYGSVNADKTDGNYYLTTVPANEIACDDLSSSEGNKCDGKGAYFVAFDIFLKTSEDVTIGLGTGSDVTAKGDVDKGIKNTARVAIINEGYIDTATYEGTNGVKLAQELIDESSDLQAIFWEPNYDTHTLAGVANANAVYSITTSTTGGTLLSYKGVKTTIPVESKVDITKTSDNPAFDAISASKYINTPANNSSNGQDKNLFELKAGVTKLRVYFWVEGQDVDTENNATGTEMLLNLEFKILD